MSTGGGALEIASIPSSSTTENHAAAAAALDIGSE